MDTEREPQGEQPPEEAPGEREFEAGREAEQPPARSPETAHGDAERVRQEAEAAAEEAASIGGRVDPDAPDEAERALREHGGGEAEGFEAAEGALIEEAQHGEGRDPSADEHLVAEEAERDTASHGEPDQIRSTEGPDELEGEDAERE